MAFPWTGEENFEDGTLGAFNSETDTGSILDFPHYSTLAGIPGMAMPWRGAYCMRVALAGGTADAYVQENDDWDIAANGTLYFSFRVWLDPSMEAANNDLFAIWQLESSGPTVEAAVFLQYTTANGWRLGLNETAADSGASYQDIALGQWHTVEVFVNLDAGGGNDGTLDAWLNGSAFTQLTSLDQGAIIQGKLGAIGPDAGTSGVLLFDDVRADDAQIYGKDDHRFSETITLTKSGHVFVGAGQIDNITLNAGAGTDCVLEVFDTDTANTNQQYKLRMTNTANNELVDPAGMPLNVHHGCYVSLSGTDPRATVSICKGAMNEAAMRSVAKRRTG